MALDPQQEKEIGIGLGVVALIGGVLFYFWYQSQQTTIPTTNTVPTSTAICTIGAGQVIPPPPTTTSQPVNLAPAVLTVANTIKPIAAPIAASQARVVNMPS